MSLFGKVLIFFNLLAAGAFVYFTLENWQKRQELTWAAFRGQLLLDGLPVEPAEAPPADLGEGRVAFNYQYRGTMYTSIPMTRLKDIVPDGDAEFGGETVANQTEEIKRLHKKVLANLKGIEVNGGRDRLAGLQLYLINISKGGAERDGINAIFDQLDAGKRISARKDLALLGRTSSQVEALKAYVEVLDLDFATLLTDTARNTAIAAKREVIRRFVLGEVPHGAAAGAETDELNRLMTNLLAGPNDGLKQQVKDAAKANPAAFAHVADVAANPLTDKAQVDAAANSLLEYVKAKKASEPELATINAVAALIREKVAANAAFPVDLIDKAATALLNERFESASAAAGKPETMGGKARAISHILYHIDAHRHNVTVPDVVAARQAWHYRVAWIIGLPEYVRVTEAQASENAESILRLAALITDEESGFREEYQAAVQKVRSLQSRFEALTAQFKDQDTITKENERLRDERLTERDNLRKELAAAEADAAAALQRLSEVQQARFGIQKQLRDAQEAILALEKQLRQRELGN